MGANITGVGSNLLVIEGVKILVDVSIGFTR
jgi:UDP-N-acetylglucosamine enolpyruvyl transferase